MWENEHPAENVVTNTVVQRPQHTAASHVVPSASSTLPIKETTSADHDVELSWANFDEARKQNENTK